VSWVVSRCALFRFGGDFGCPKMFKTWASMTIMRGNSIHNKLGGAPLLRGLQLPNAIKRRAKHQGPAGEAPVANFPGKTRSSRAGIRKVRICINPAAKQQTKTSGGKNNMGFFFFFLKLCDSFPKVAKKSFGSRRMGFFARSKPAERAAELQGTPPKTQNDNRPIHFKVTIR